MKRVALGILVTLLTGCTPSNLTDMVGALAKDPNSGCGSTSVNTIYGTTKSAVLHAGGTGMQGVKMSTSGGDCLMESQATTVPNGSMLVPAAPKGQ